MAMERDAAEREREFQAAMRNASPTLMTRLVMAVFEVDPASVVASLVLLFFWPIILLWWWLDWKRARALKRRLDRSALAATEPSSQQ